MRLLEVLLRSLEGGYTFEYVDCRAEHDPDCSPGFFMAGIFEHAFKSQHGYAAYAGPGYADTDSSALTDSTQFEKAPGPSEAEVRWRLCCADWRPATGGWRQVRSSVTPFVHNNLV